MFLLAIINYLECIIFEVYLLARRKFSFFHSKMETSSTSLNNPQIPHFNGKNYDYWSITMKALFLSQDIWDLVENGFPVQQMQ